MDLARLLKACADRTRLRLINLLGAGGEVCVCHLVAVLGTNQPKVSRHLAYLKRAGLVGDRKEGLWVYYRLVAPSDEDAGRLLDCLSFCFAEAPEMRRDLARLAEVQAAQPSVGLSRRAPAVTASAEELQVELL